MGPTFLISRGKLINHSRDSRFKDLLFPCLEMKWIKKQDSAISDTVSRCLVAITKIKSRELLHAWFVGHFFIRVGQQEISLSFYILRCTCERPQARTTIVPSPSEEWTIKGLLHWLETIVITWLTRDDWPSGCHPHYKIKILQQLKYRFHFETHRLSFWGSFNGEKQTTFTVKNNF